MAENVGGDGPELGGHWRGSFRWEHHDFVRVDSIVLRQGERGGVQGDTETVAPDDTPNLTLSVGLRGSGPGLPQASLRGEFTAWVPGAEPPRAAGRITLLIASNRQLVGRAHFTHKGAPASAVVHLTPAEQQADAPPAVEVAD